MKAAKRSDFSLTKTVEATHVSKEVQPGKLECTDPSLFKLAHTPQIESDELDPETKADMNLQALKDVQALSEIEDALHHGRSLRGKSAKAIEYQLKTSALRNLTRSQELADIRKFQRESVHVLWDESDHHRMMDDRFRSLMDVEKSTEPRTTILNKEMQTYDKTSSQYFLDKRYF